MFDPRPLCCSSLTTAVGGTTDTNFVDSAHPTVARITSSIGNLQQEKGKLPSQLVQNPQGQNSVGSLGSNEGTFEHCKAVTTLRSGRVVDKTIPTKKPLQESQRELVREDEISDKPHDPSTKEFDDHPEEDKSTHIPPAPYPHRLRAPKKMNNHSEIYELFK